MGQQASGTFSWLTHAIRYYGLDMKYDLNLVEDVYASKLASQLALQAGQVDVIVDDFIGAVNMREAGVPVRAIWPFRMPSAAPHPPDYQPSQLESINA